MGNTAIAVRRQEEHLVFEGICAERPAVAEDDGLSPAPVIITDLGAVPRRDRRHDSLSLWWTRRGSRYRPVGGHMVTMTSLEWVPPAARDPSAESKRGKKYGLALVQDCYVWLRIGESLQSAEPFFPLRDCGRSVLSDRSITAAAAFESRSRGPWACPSPLKHRFDDPPLIVAEFIPHDSRARQSTANRPSLQCDDAVGNRRLSGLSQARRARV